MDPLDSRSFIYEQGKAQFVNTVDENLEYMTERQIKRAKKARELYKAMGSPTIEDLKAIIRMNLIKNNEVSTADVNLAEKAFGPDIGAIKGKTTRRKPMPVVDNQIEIPDELVEVQKDVILLIDGIKVKVGQTLKAGDVIGSISTRRYKNGVMLGTTGITTGPHIHYVVWDSAGNYLDPKKYGAIGGR